MCTCMQVRCVCVVPSYLTCATLSKDLSPIFLLQFCPALSSWNANMYLVFSVFTSRPTFFLVNNKGSKLLCFHRSTYGWYGKLTSLLHARSWHVLFTLNPSWSARTSVMAHSKDNLKRMVIKHLFVSDQSEYRMYQIFAYMYFTTGFI